MLPSPNIRSSSLSMIVKAWKSYAVDLCYCGTENLWNLWISAWFRMYVWDASVFSKLEKLNCKLGLQESFLIHGAADSLNTRRSAARVSFGLLIPLPWCRFPCWTELQGYGVRRKIIKGMSRERRHILKNRVVEWCSKFFVVVSTKISLHVKLKFLGNDLHSFDTDPRQFLISLCPLFDSISLLQSDCSCRASNPFEQSLKPPSGPKQSQTMLPAPLYELWAFQRHSNI